MNADLFRKITQTLKQQFPKASDEFLMQQAREMYEAEMQRRSKLSKVEQLSAKYRDILDR